MVPDTIHVVDAFYSAYVVGDQAGMLAFMSCTVSLRFLGRVELEGINEVRKFLAFNEGTREALDFRIRRRLVDGEWAAVIWSETARVAETGAPWQNHGVDVLRIHNGEVELVHVNNDLRVVRTHLPSYE